MGTVRTLAQRQLAQLPPRLARPLRLHYRQAVALRRFLRNTLQTWTTDLQTERQHLAALGQIARLEGQHDLRLHLGCGANVKPGWLNIDLHPAADLHLDLRRGLPFPDASAAVIYSEHFFEHLEYPREVVPLLADARRVLQPGGLFQVGVPSTETILRAYVANDTELFRIARELWHPAWCDTPLHQVNFHFRQLTEHKYAYDWETLASVLAAAGFVAIQERAYLPGLDLAERALGTLYVDARAPGGVAADAPARETALTRD